MRAQETRVIQLQSVRQGSVNTPQPQILSGGIGGQESIINQIDLSMAGCLRNHFLAGAMASGILLLILGPLVFAASLIQVNQFNGWMKHFMEFGVHQTVFIYLHANSYIIILLGAAMMAIIGNRKIDWLNYFALIALTLVLASSLAMIVLCALKPPKLIFESCEAQPIYTGAYNKAKQIFCQSSCRCYLFQNEKSSYLNKTTTNEAAAKKVQDCGQVWAATQADEALKNAQQQFECSGWCEQEQIYYFSANDVYVNGELWGSSTHKRRYAKRACFPEVQMRMYIAFWRLPLGIAGVTVLICLFDIAMMIEIVRLRLSDSNGFY